jgi:hypothetical protein
MHAIDSTSQAIRVRAQGGLPGRQTQHRGTLDTGLTRASSIGRRPTLTRVGFWLSRRGVRGALCVSVLLAMMVLGTATARASLTFFSGPTYAFGSASDTSPLALAALRPGGPADLVAVDHLAPGSIMVRLGSGDGTFKAPVVSDLR